MGMLAVNGPILALNEYIYLEQVNMDVSLLYVTNDLLVKHANTKQYPGGTFFELSGISCRYDCLTTVT